MPAVVVYGIAIVWSVGIADSLIQRRFILAVVLIALLAYAITTSPYITFTGA